MGKKGMACARDGPVNLHHHLGAVIIGDDVDIYMTSPSTISPVSNGTKEKEQEKKGKKKRREKKRRTTLLPRPDLVPNTVDRVPLREGAAGEEIVAAVGEAVTFVCSSPRPNQPVLTFHQSLLLEGKGRGWEEKGQREKRDAHFVFCTLATNFFFANSPNALLTPPERDPAIWAIRGEGTTSWFLEPCST